MIYKVIYGKEKGEESRLRLTELMHAQSFVHYTIKDFASNEKSRSEVKEFENTTQHEII